MKKQITDEPLSYSRVSSFLGCQQAFQYSYIERLTRKYEFPRITRGKLVDDGICEAIAAQEEGHDLADCQLVACDAIAKAGREWIASEDVAAFLDMSPGLRAESCDLVAEAQIIARRAIKSIGIGTGKWRTVPVENMAGVQLKVRGELANWAPGFEGYVDWLAEDKETGHVWLIDFKVRDAFQSEEDLAFDYQLPLYQRCVEQMLGREITGTAHFQIRSKVPSEPKILKSGRVSSNILGTDFDTYVAALDGNQEDHSEYTEQLDKLRGKNFDRFTPIYRSRQEIDGIWDELECAAYGLKKYDEHGVSTRRLHLMQCRGCRFQDLCLAELRGHDADHIRKTAYTKKKDRT